MNSKNNNYNLETTSLETKSMSALTSSNTMNVIKRDGKMEPMDFEKIIFHIKFVSSRKKLPTINIYSRPSDIGVFITN